MSELLAQLEPQTRERVQERLWTVLEKQMRRYTQGDSESLPMERAQELLDGVAYTLTTQLQAQDLSPQALLTEDLDKLLAEGQQTLRKQLKECQRLYEGVRRTTPDIDNVSQKTTLQSIEGFFGRYDTMFFPQRIPCDIDYQLCHPAPESERGVGYVWRYMGHLAIENELLSHFETKRVISVLQSFCPDYRGLLINLYEPIAANTIGLAILGESICPLDIAWENRERLEKLFEGRTGREVHALLQKGGQAVCGQMGIRQPEARRYLLEAAAQLEPRISATLSSGGLKGVFTSIG